jgi:soluble lytic murein transglycosylase-like protein
MSADERTDNHEHSQPGLGLRHSEERRHHQRRGHIRGFNDRRRADRRRATIRSLVLSALALAAPQAVKRATGLPIVPSLRAAPLVTVSMDSFQALSPAHAYDDVIQQAADTYRVDAALIRSVIRAESGFNPLAVSRVGAMGLMQLMPDVAEELGVEDPFDPRQNIMGGARLLRDLLDTHHGSVPITLASYNAGPGAVASHGGRVPPFKETQAYVKRITGWLAQERATGD